MIKDLETISGFFHYYAFYYFYFLGLPGSANLTAYPIISANLNVSIIRRFSHVPVFLLSLMLSFRPLTVPIVFCIVMTTISWIVNNNFTFYFKESFENSIYAYSAISDYKLYLFILWLYSIPFEFSFYPGLCFIYLGLSDTLDYLILLISLVISY